MAHPPPDPTRSLGTLLHHVSVIDSLLVQHKAPQPVVRAWQAAFAACRATVVDALAACCRAPSVSDSPIASTIDVFACVKPLVDVLQRYFEAGPVLVIQVLECLLDLEFLTNPGIFP